MQKTLNRMLFLLVLASWTTLIPNARAQSSAPPLAPLPSQIATAKKVFVSNAGGDSKDLFSGGPNRLYNQFYAELKRWGRYQLVGQPGDADLVFEISFMNPLIGAEVSGGGGGGTPVSGHAVTDPQFRVAVIDPGTRIVLWTFTRHIEQALLQGNRDKNFDRTLTALLEDVRDFVSQAPNAASDVK